MAVDTSRYGRRKRDADQALAFQMGSAGDLSAAVRAIDDEVKAQAKLRREQERQAMQDTERRDDRQQEQADRAASATTRAIDVKSRMDDREAKRSTEEANQRKADTVSRAAALQSRQGFISGTELAQLAGKDMTPDELLAAVEGINQEAFDKGEKYRRESSKEDLTSRKTESEIKKNEAMAKKAAMPKPEPSPASLERVAKKDRLLDLQIAAAEGRNAPDVAPLRKEFNALPAVKAFNEVDISLKKMEDAAARPSAAGDLSLIFSFMKMLDPGSTVREGEFANAQNAAGVPDQIRNQFNKILSGERLNDTQRGDFLGSARNFHAAHRKAYEAEAARYEGLARRGGGAPVDVTGRTSVEDDAAELGIILE
jgi:hypothetical protein